MLVHPKQQHFAPTFAGQKGQKLLISPDTLKQYPPCHFVKTTINAMTFQVTVNYMMIIYRQIDDQKGESTDPQSNQSTNPRERHPDPKPSAVEFRSPAYWIQCPQLQGMVTGDTKPRLLGERCDQTRGISVQNNQQIWWLQTTGAQICMSLLNCLELSQCGPATSQQLLRVKIW